MRRIYSKIQSASSPALILLLKFQLSTSILSPCVHPVPESTAPRAALGLMPTSPALDLSKAAQIFGSSWALVLHLGVPQCQGIMNTNPAELGGQEGLKMGQLRSFSSVLTSSRQSEGREAAPLGAPAVPALSPLGSCASTAEAPPGQWHKSGILVLVFFFPFFPFNPSTDGHKGTTATEAAR